MTKSKSYEIEGKSLTCRVCDNDKFMHRRTLMNTPGMTFMGFEWANAQADNYVCDKCGYVHWFLHEKG